MQKQLIANEQESAYDFMIPSNFDQAIKIGEFLAGSEMVPQSYRGKPQDIVVAMAMGAELGFKPMQSLQNLAVINGKPSVFGDGFRALIVSAPDLVSIDDHFDTQTQTATCTIVRKLSTGGHATFTGSFSIADAKSAGLTNRDPWKKYPKRMLQWRALGFAGRDAYADRLRGIWIQSEVDDLVEKDVNPPPARRYASAATQSKTLNSLISEVAPVKSEDVVKSMSELVIGLEQSLRECGAMNQLGELALTIRQESEAKNISDKEREYLQGVYVECVKSIKAANAVVESQASEE